MFGDRAPSTLPAHRNTGRVTCAPRASSSWAQALSHWRRHRHSWRPLVTAQSTSTTQRRRSHWRHHSVTGAGRGRGTALPRAPASAQRRSAGRRHGAGHWRIMTNTGALTLAPGPAHPRLPQLPWALLGTVSTSTGPWAPHHRTTAAATSQRPPAWWWVWCCWAQHAQRGAARGRMRVRT